MYLVAESQQANELLAKFTVGTENEPHQVQVGKGGKRS
jgi:hypothetical protein